MRSSNLQLQRSVLGLICAQLLVVAGIAPACAAPGAQQQHKVPAVRIASSGKTKPAEKSSEPQAEASPEEKYFASMKPLIERYDNVLLELLDSDSVVDKKSADPKPTLDSVEHLQQELQTLQAPSDLQMQQTELQNILSSVIDFIKNGGTVKLGFHDALQLAQQMRTAFEEYRDAGISLMQKDHIAANKAPFFCQGTASGASVPDADDSSTADHRDLDRVRNGTSHDILNRNNSIASTRSGNASFISGTDGTSGLSGLFNGLAGTGTNGLVEGFGFASGLNGFVNGTGASSGMSGMFNDVNPTSNK